VVVHPIQRLSYVLYDGRFNAGAEIRPLYTEFGSLLLPDPVTYQMGTEGEAALSHLSVCCRG